MMLINAIKIVTTVVILMPSTCKPAPIGSSLSGLNHDDSVSFMTPQGLMSMPLMINGYAAPVPDAITLRPMISLRNRDEEVDPPTPDPDDHEEPTPEDGDCGWPALTPSLYNDGIRGKLDDWIRAQARQYVKYHAKHGPGSNATAAFHWYLMKSWVPKLSPDVTFCNLDKFCSILGCENILKRPGITDEQRKLAYYAFEIFKIWYDNQGFLVKDIEQAADNLNLRLDGFVKDFTDTDKLLTSMERQKAQDAKKVHIMGLLMMTITPLIAGAGSIIAGPAAPVAAAVTSAITGFVSGAYMGAIGLWMDGRPGVSNPTLTLTADTGELIMNVTKYIGASITNSTTQVIRGPGIDSDAQPLIDLLNSGQGLERTMRPNGRSTKIEEELATLIINYLWNNAWVYIVRANAKGPCQSDPRISPQVRVCLPEMPDSVFQILFIGTEKEKRKEAAFLRGPPGYTKLGSGKYVGTTFEQVVRDSVRYKAMHGYDIVPMNATTFDGVIDKINGGGDPKELYPTFTIPIVESPNGEALTSINNKDDRNYPMMTGPCSWDRVTEECNLENHAFLQRTGLFASDDYSFMASKHQVRWSQDSVQFETPNQDAVKIHYAVHNIGEHKDHEHWGHEDPGDDGTFDHKDETYGYCNKKHFDKFHKDQGDSSPCLRGDHHGHLGGHHHPPRGES